MDQHWTEGRRTRPRLEHPKVAQNAAWSPREVRPLGSCQVSRRSGGGAARVRPLSVRGRGRTNTPRTGCRPCPVGREGSPSRREVDGRADDIALHACLLELPQGKPSLADQRCVSL